MDVREIQVSCHTQPSWDGLVLGLCSQGTEALDMEVQGMGL